MSEPGGHIVRVDRNNNVLVEIASGAFARTRIDPQRFQSFYYPGGAPALIRSS